MPITSVRSGQILDLTIVDSDVAPTAGIQSSKLDLSAIGQPVKITYVNGLRLEAVDPRLEFRDTNIALPNGLWRMGLGVSFDNIFDIEQNTAAAGDFSTRTLRLRITNTGVLLCPTRIDTEQFHFTSFVPVSGIQGDSLFASDADFRLHYKKGGADKVVAFREEIGDRGFVTTVSASTSLSLNAHDVVLVNAVGAPITISLPTAVGSAGKTYSIKKIDTSGNAVTIDPDLSETIDGSATRVLTTPNESVTIVSDGTNWRVIG